MEQQGRNSYVGTVSSKKTVRYIRTPTNVFLTHKKTEVHDFKRVSTSVFYSSSILASIES